MLLLGHFVGCDRRRLVICGGEELRPEECVLCELPTSAASVRVLWELLDSVRQVPVLDPLSTGTALRLHLYIFPTHGAGWLRELA